VESFEVKTSSQKAITVPRSGLLDPDNRHFFHIFVNNNLIERTWGCGLSARLGAEYPAWRTTFPWGC
jgi:hypothetical protein